jgi:cell division transport system permease protein
LNQPRVQRRRGNHRIRAWASLHLQCAIASLGSLWRARWGTALTAAVIGIALALPMAAYLAVHSVARIAEGIDLDAQISVFLHPELSNLDAQTLADEFASRSEILSARVITKEQGLAEFRKAAGLAGGLEQVAKDNPLPAVIMLVADRLESTELAAMAASIAQLKAVEFVQMDQDWVRRLDAFLQLARQLLGLVSLLLGTGVMLIVGNTLRLSIESRRAEIEIAKLFGASDAFVRRAFLYHGMYFGLAGAVVACVLVAVAALVLHGPVSRLGSLYMGELALDGPGLAHLLALLLIGGGLGWLGAWLSVAHHLRAIEPR